MNINDLEIDKTKLKYAAMFAAGAFFMWCLFAMLDKAEDLQVQSNKEAFQRGYQEGLLYKIEA